MPDTQSVPSGLVSIIILTWNQLEYTRLCIESVLQNTPQPYELIFVDNGSTDGTVDFLRTIPNVKLVVNNENLGFAAGNNQGLAIADGEYVLLLNNDTMVPEGWLARMLAPLRRHSEIGIVGPRSNHVAAPQLVPNVPYTDAEGMYAFAEAWSRDHAGEGWPIDAVVGFCLLARRAVVDRIGGLDPVFGSGNFEDNDFCLRALLAGWASWVAGDAFVHHFGSRTFLGSGINYEQSMRRNSATYSQKWGIPDPLDSRERVSLARFAAANPFVRSKHFIPLPDNVRFTSITPELAAYHTGLQRLDGAGPAEALPYLERAVAHAPQVADFHNALGAVYFEMGRRSEAVEAFRRAAALAPANADFEANLAEALRQL